MADAGTTTLHQLADEWQHNVERDALAITAHAARVAEWEKAVLAADADVERVTRRIEHLTLLQRDGADDAAEARANHKEIHRALRATEDSIDALHAQPPSSATTAPNGSGGGGGGGGGVVVRGPARGR